MAGNLPVGEAWYCVCAQPKHEHIAAAHLRKDASLEVFLPRIRFKRATRLGPQWVTEALFPNYLFARFDLSIRLRQVCASRGVRGVVHFGEHWPSIPADVIQRLQTAVGTEEVRELAVDPKPGDAIHVVEGPFAGLEAVVTRVMPGRDRVAVLMNILGQPSTVEIPRHQFTLENENPRAKF